MNFFVVVSNDVEIVVLSVFRTWYGTRVAFEVLRVKIGDLVVSSISLFSGKESKISILDAFFSVELELAPVTASLSLVIVVSSSTDGNDIMN